MNAERRQKIEQATRILSSVLDEEQDAYDNLPESSQDGEKGEAMQSAIENLEEAINALDNIE